MIALSLITYALLLGLATFAVGRARWLPWLAFGALPLALTPYWAHGEHALFMWFKVYSVCAGALWVQALRDPQVARWSGAGAVTWAILALNIGEAVATEAAAGGWANALAGVVLIALQPSPREGRVVAQRGRPEFAWDTSRAWVLAYALWNTAFILGVWPRYGGLQLAVVSVATLAGLIWPSAWFRFRAISLALHMIVAFTAWGLFDPALMTPGMASPTTLAVARALSITSAAGLVAWRLRSSRTVAA